jgi:hypothetical protein
MREKFLHDKRSTLTAVEDFLKKPPVHVPDIEELEKERADIVDNFTTENFTETLQRLEILRAAKSGIMLYKTEQDGLPVMVRDARHAKRPPVRETEAFEMQYLNAIRAGMDILDIEQKSPLKDDLQTEAQDFLKNFSVKNAGKSQEELSEILKGKIDDLGKFLESKGVPNAYEKLNVAKDFQNFNDSHFNIATVSSVQDSKGVDHVVVETEVAMKNLTATQKTQYENISEGHNQPAWYKAMQPWEQELCKKYAGKIADGQHVIPTQLRQIAGMKNAFEKITAVYDDKKEELEVLHSSKHAGTLASFARDKNSRQNIANENSRQAKKWIGEKNKLHCNTLNSGPLGWGNDPKIVKQTKKAMEDVGGKETNTAFNLFRYSGFANHLDGAKDTLRNLASCLPDTDEFKKLKSHLQPRGFWGRLFRFGNPKNEMNKLLGEGKIDKETFKILKNAVDLRRSMKKAGSILRWGDAENVSLTTSRKLNELSQSISKTEEIPKGMTKLPEKEEILRMCASGKDRTGLAEHDQTAQVIAEKFGLQVADVDKQLLPSGHTAQQAGGIFAGGATIGCFGTKKENKPGIPKSRTASLAGIIEVTSSSNKIKGESKLKEGERSKSETKKSSMIKKSRSTGRNNEREPLLQPSSTPPQSKERPRER